MGKTFLTGLNVFLFSQAARAQELRDVHPPVEYTTFPWLLWASVALFVGAGLFVLYIFLSKPRGGQHMISPKEKALHQLKLIEQGGSPDKAAIRGNYFALSDIARSFIEEQFGIRAVEMTTAELIPEIRAGSYFTDELKSALKDFFLECDEVKFAKHYPPRETLRKHLNFIQEFVNQVGEES